MKRLWYIFVVSIVFLCQACRQNTADVEQCLDTAEELMIERPDSALSILENISIEQVSSRKDRARYALLYTQAKDKNFIDETDIKLISEAKEYYDDSNDIKSKFLSLYYYGRILCNNGNYPHAIIAYTQAECLLEGFIKDNLNISQEDRDAFIEVIRDTIHLLDLTEVYKKAENKGATPSIEDLIDNLKSLEYRIKNIADKLYFTPYNTME